MGKVPGSGNYVVTPLKGKGLLEVQRSTGQGPEGEGMLHVVWMDRKTMEVGEDADFIVFEKEATFNKIDTGKVHERVYALQFGNSERRFFFWMQDPCGSEEEALEKDGEVAAKVNAYMNDKERAKRKAGGEEDAWKDEVRGREGKRREEVWRRSVEKTRERASSSFLRTTPKPPRS